MRETPDDLKNERNEFNHWSTLFKDKISEVLEELGDNTKIKQDHEVWDELKNKLREPLFWTSEITVRTISIQVLEEFIRAYFQTL